MDTLSGPSRRDWAVLGAMLVLCVLLLALQYRWTGALSQAELATLNASLRAQTVQVSDSFDAELRRLCASLLPSVRELDTLGFQPAHLARLADWRSNESRRPFRRVAVIAPNSQDLVVYALDLGGSAGDVALQRVDWPASFAPLRAPLLSRWRGERGPPPSLPSDSLLLELPTLDAGREREWMVFELDDTYLRKTWLPELLAPAFAAGSNGDTRYVEVRTNTTPARTVINWPTGSPPPARRPDASAELFPKALIGPPRGRAESSRWTIQVWYGPRPLEAVVATTRLRNLAVAAILIGLIVATAWARTQVAGRARRLAARELAFVAGISHELRTPLTAIRGAGHNLRASLVTDVDKQRAYGQLIVERADQLTAMVEQLLSLASLRHSAHPAAPGPVSVGEFLQEAMRTTAEAAANAGCRVDVDVDPALPAVLGDAAALRRAFENLIMNAVTHGAQGGWVGLTARAVRRAGSCVVEVSVADRGPGVAAQELSRIWEPFEQGAMSQGHPHRGFGLGLSLVRETVARHGGRVRLESPSGRGATFVVDLPASEDV